MLCVVLRDISPQYLGSSYSMVLLQLTTILGAMTILDKAVRPLAMR